MSNHKDFTTTHKRGIDDLKSLYVFHYSGDGGGGHSSNDLDEYINFTRCVGTWGTVEFDGDCPLTKEGIASEIEKRQAWNDEYVTQLKKEGRYGEEYSMNYRVMNMDEFDKPSTGNPMEGFGVIIPKKNK